MYSNVIRYLHFVFVISFCAAFNPKLPYSVLSECKEYFAGEFSNYDDAFAISDMKNNKPFENEIYRMKFYVFTRHNAHILITNEPKAQTNDAAYEIGGYLIKKTGKITPSSIHSSWRSFQHRISDQVCKRWNPRPLQVWQNHFAFVSNRVYSCDARGWRVISNPSRLWKTLHGFQGQITKILDLLLDVSVPWISSALVLWLSSR